MKNFEVDDEVVSTDPRYFGSRGIILDKEVRSYFFFFIRTVYCISWEDGCVYWDYDKYIEKYNPRTCK